MNKKGNIRDILFLIVVLFFVGIFCFIGMYTFNQVSNKLMASSVINETEETTEVLTAMQGQTGLFDYFGLAIFIGMTIAIIITGWFIGGNTLFMIIYFIVEVAGVIVTMVLSNAWEAIYQASKFGGLTLPITNHLITYLPVYITIVAFLGMIAMFAKPYLMGGGEY